jgi:hypothetical protein
MINFASRTFGLSQLKTWPFHILFAVPDFFIPEKDGEHWEPSIYKGRD